jgi:hypothetical protein
VISIVKAQQLADELSEFFEIDTPIVKFARSDSTRSWYHGKTNTISLCKKSADINSLLHEFAHHFITEKGVDENHGEYFVRVLSWIAEYYYGNADKYPWRWEYYRVHEIYKRLKEGEN